MRKANIKPNCPNCPGVLLLVLTGLDVDNILRGCQMRSWCGRQLVQLSVLSLSVAALILPLVGGLLLHHAHRQEQVVMLLAEDFGSEDNSRQVSIIFLSRVNSPQLRDLPGGSGEWLQVRQTEEKLVTIFLCQTVTCLEELHQAERTPRVLLADLHEETCLTLLSNQKLISEKSNLSLVLQTGNRDWTGHNRA